MRYIVGLFVVLLLLTGCKEKYPHTFKSGDIVITKIDGRKGMIIRTYTYHNGLDIRFSADTEMTTDSFLGGTYDITKKPYALVFMREFEVVPAN